MQAVSNFNRLQDKDSARPEVKTYMVKAAGETE